MIELRILTMLSLLLVASCGQTVTIVKCPPPPWPASDVIETIQKVGKGDASFAGWFKDVAQHFTECDVLNE